MGAAECVAAAAEWPAARFERRAIRESRTECFVECAE